MLHSIRGICVFHEMEPVSDKIGFFILFTWHGCHGYHGIDETFMNVGRILFQNTPNDIITVESVCSAQQNPCQEQLRC